MLKRFFPGFYLARTQTRALEALAHATSSSWWSTRTGSDQHGAENPLLHVVPSREPKLTRTAAATE
jgi:hypothetical protein